MNTTPLTLEERLAKIDKLGEEFTHKLPSLVGSDSEISYCDFFVFGAIRRMLAQIAGFCQLIEAKNFPCAASILRMQIDTAMRINALTIVEDRESMCAAILKGEHLNTLRALDGKKLSDAYLCAKLTEKHSWVARVYEQTSDFIHLSGRHLYSSIESMDDDTRTVNFSISGVDPPRPESDYFEIVSTFFEATKLISILCVEYFYHRASADSPPPDSDANGDETGNSA